MDKKCDELHSSETDCLQQEKPTNILMLKTSGMTFCKQICQTFSILSVVSVIMVKTKQCIQQQEPRRPDQS